MKTARVDTMETLDHLDKMKLIKRQNVAKVFVNAVFLAVMHYQQLITLKKIHVKCLRTR